MRPETQRARRVRTVAERSGSDQAIEQSDAQAAAEQLRGEPLTEEQTVMGVSPEPERAPVSAES